MRDASIAAAIALAATLFPYYRGLHFPFSLDDYTFLFQSAGLDPAPFSLRRWLAVRGYYGLWLEIFGPNPVAWHVTSYVLHVANAVWVQALARRLGASRAAAWIACGLFAASPVAFTVLYWAAGIQEIGSTFFLLAAFWCIVRGGRALWVSVPLFACAMLFKESVIVAPLVLPLLLGKRVLRPALALLAVGIAIFVASGLHQRMLESSRDLPYATAYDQTLLVNLATIFIWWLAPWRAYPDRIPGPQPGLVLPALAVAGAIGVVLLVKRGPYARWVGLAACWFVALLLPVLPLRQHTYAYYAYASQIGFLILAGVGIERLAQRWLRSPRAVEMVGSVVVAAIILLAARNARTHEDLTLPNSPVPHDSMIRYGRTAGALVAAVREARLPSGVARVGFMNMPEQLGSTGHTPGKHEPGMVRVRKFPLRESIYNGKLFALYFPKLQGVWVDSLGPNFEGPETALFFTSGFNTVTRVPDASQAYCLQAQGHVLVNDFDAARRDLSRALELDPTNMGARILLAGVLLQAGDAGGALPLVAGIDSATVPDELRSFYDEIRKALGLATHDATRPGNPTAPGDPAAPSAPPNPPRGADSTRAPLPGS